MSYSIGIAKEFEIIPFSRPVVTIDDRPDPFEMVSHDNFDDEDWEKLGGEEHLQATERKKPSYADIMKR